MLTGTAQAKPRQYQPTPLKQLLIASLWNISVLGLQGNNDQVVLLTFPTAPC